MWIYHLLHQLGCRYIHIHSIFHCSSMYFLQCSSTLKFHNWHLLVQAWIHDQFLSLQRKLSICAEHRASAIERIEIRTNMTTFWNPEEINMKNYEKLWKTWKDLERPNTFQDLSPTAGPALLAEPSLFTSETCRREDLKFQGQHSMQQERRCNKRAHSMTACRARHFSVTQPRPSMRHSLGNQSTFKSTQFWGSGLDV